ncbi:MAG: hypothetical protein KDB03_16910 [Planctomycetales bacterium]|nr:hypothetical protein [Planctomycetales bacterium]
MITLSNHIARLLSGSFLAFWMIVTSGCKLTELDVVPITVSGIPIRGSDVCCPVEEDRGTAAPIGNVRLSQYGPVAICKDELADKVVPWHMPPDCDGSELIFERILGRRRLGHTIPLLGWVGIGRFSEPGKYSLYRTTQRELECIANAKLYFCVKDSITVDGIRFSDDDVIAYDGKHVAKLIDGGDLGTSQEEIDAFTAISPTSFLISYRSDFEIDLDHPLPGLTGTVRDEDILLFEANSLGEITRGVFSRFLDTSHLGIDGGTDIDAMEAISLDKILCSFDRRTKLEDLTVEANDIVELQLEREGENMVAGKWKLIREGDKCGLKGQNIDGLGVDENGRYLISVEDRFLAQNVVFDPATSYILPNHDDATALSPSDVITHDMPLSLRGTSLSGNNITAIALPPSNVRN